MNKIIVFDTGTGGKIFAEYFRQEIQGAEIIEVIDSANAPYGSRTPSEILTLTEQTLKPYINTSALIAIACNTATAYALSYLRTKYPDQLFVGAEPAVKPAVRLTKNGKALILATPATVNSAHYQNLKTKHAKHVTLYEPNCADWAQKIDDGTLTKGDIIATLDPYRPFSPDTIILACTHYLAISPRTFTDIFPNARIYSPLPAVTDHIKSLLPQQ